MSKKKMAAILAAALIMTATAACGNEKPQTQESAQPQETAQTTETTPQTTAEAQPENTPAQSTQAPAAGTSVQTVQPTKETALKYVGSSVSALYGAVGYPTSSDYAPSCLGDGEDGSLYYNGFVVYTYRENSSESVVAVE